MRRNFTSRAKACRGHWLAELERRLNAAGMTLRNYDWTVDRWFEQGLAGPKDVHHSNVWGVSMLFDAGRLDRNCGRIVRAVVPISHAAILDRDPEFMRCLAARVAEGLIRQMWRGRHERRRRKGADHRRR